jgi:uncharacterized protein
MSMQLENPSSRWWQHGMVWLVLSGPAIVVVAGFATLAIAIAYPDPVLPTNLSPTATPAVRARNHAAERAGDASGARAPSPARDQAVPVNAPRVDTGRGGAP